MASLRSSTWRKLIATGVAAVTFVALYEVSVLDSKFITRKIPGPSGKPVAGSKLLFTATAYCKGLTTASGVAVQKGAVAADPDLLPAGTLVEIDTRMKGHDGLYTVLDTGPKIQGRLLDIYMWSCYDALAFGKRDVSITVLRLGWNPQATAPTRSFLDRWFRRQPTPPPAPIASPSPSSAEPAATEPAAVQPKS